METDEQREAKLVKRRENYQKRKASVSDEQRQANHAKEIDNYRKRKASEPDKQRDAKLARKLSKEESFPGDIFVIPSVFINRYFCCQF